MVASLVLKAMRIAISIRRICRESMYDIRTLSRDIDGVFQPKKL